MEGHDPKTEVFLRAYDDLSDALFRHCYFRVYDRERARELMQEAFTRTWEQIANGKEIENLKAFLYRVTNNLVIDASRKRKESSLEKIMEAGFEPSDRSDVLTVVNAETALVMEVLESMEDDSIRALVIMRYIDGMGPKDIAHALGESENVISVRLHRGMKRIRIALAERQQQRQKESSTTS